MCHRDKIAQESPNQIVPHHARWDPSEPKNVEPNKAYIAKPSRVDKHESKA